MEPKFKLKEEVILVSGGGEFPLRGFNDDCRYTISEINPDHSLTHESDETTYEIKGKTNRGYALESQLNSLKTSDELYLDSLLKS